MLIKKRAYFVNTLNYDRIERISLKMPDILNSLILEQFSISQIFEKSRISRHEKFSNFFTALFDVASPQMSRRWKVPCLVYWSPWARSCLISLSKMCMEITLPFRKFWREEHKLTSDRKYRVCQKNARRIEIVLADVDISFTFR